MKYLPFIIWLLITLILYYKDLLLNNSVSSTLIVDTEII
jgi:hypothetical protein